MNIWKYTIAHKSQEKYFCEHFLENLSLMYNMTYVSGAELLLVFFIYKSNYRKTYKKGALYLTFYCYDVKSRRLTLSG